MEITFLGYLCTLFPPYLGISMRKLLKLTARKHKEAPLFQTLLKSSPAIFE